VFFRFAVLGLLNQPVRLGQELLLSLAASFRGRGTFPGLGLGAPASLLLVEVEVLQGVVDSRTSLARA